MKKNTAPKTIQDSFIDEINEDLKHENLKKIWDKYGLYIIIFVIAAIAAAVSFESIKAWRIRHHQDVSNVYAYAQNLKEMGKYEESNKVLADLQKNGGGIYADIAEMQIANNLVLQNKVSDAIAIYEKMAANKDLNPQVREVAILKLASFKLDNAPAAEIETLLTPVINNNPNWAPIAKSMLAMLAVREKDLNKAKALYEEIASDSNSPDSLKVKAQDMVAVLKENTK